MFDSCHDISITDLLVVFVTIHVVAFHTMVYVVQMWLQNSKLSLSAIPVNNLLLPAALVI
jgi:hypothetical protein